MRRVIKPGTYPATAEAAHWGNVMLALELLEARRRSQGYTNLADGIQETIDRLRPQVTEEKED